MRSDILQTAIRQRAVACTGVLQAQHPTGPLAHARGSLRGWVCLLVGVLWVGWAAGAAKADDLPTAQAVRAHGTVQVDGQLDEAFWQDAPVYSEFHRLARGGARFAGELERTEFRLAYDNEAIYAAIVCYEPRMADLIANVTQRDGSIWSDDSVEIFLRADDRFYYHFGINSQGMQYDARMPVRETVTGEVMAQGRLWDTVWDAAVVRHDDRWVLETRIPFASLDLNPDSQPQWRLNVGRTAARRKEFTSWGPVTRGFHHLDQHGHLTGIDADLSYLTVDASGLTFPGFQLGRNVLEVSLPASAAGPYLLGASLRGWQPGQSAARQQVGEPIRADNGSLAVHLPVEVTQAGVLQELALELIDQATGQTVLHRMHLFQAPDPITAELDWGVYYSSDASARLQVNLAVAAESAHGRLHAAVLRDGSVVRKDEMTIDQPGQSVMQLPVGELEPGFYQLQVAAELIGMQPVEHVLHFHVVPGPFDNF